MSDEIRLDQLLKDALKILLIGSVVFHELLTHRPKADRGSEAVCAGNRGLKRC